MHVVQNCELPFEVSMLNDGYIQILVSEVGRVELIFRSELISNLCSLILYSLRFMVRNGDCLLTSRIDVVFVYFYGIN